MNRRDMKTDNSPWSTTLIRADYSRAKRDAHSSLDNHQRKQMVRVGNSRCERFRLDDAGRECS